MRPMLTGDLRTNVRVCVCVCVRAGSETLFDPVDELKRGLIRQQPVCPIYTNIALRDLRTRLHAVEQENLCVCLVWVMRALA